MIIDLHPYRLPLHSALTTAHGTVEARDGVLVSVSDGQHVGWGDAAPMPGWSDGTLDEVTASLAAVAAAGEIEVDTVLESLETRPEARAALAGAFADLTARRRGMSLARSLDPDAHDSVAVAAMISSPSPEEAAARAADAVAMGIGAIKLKVAVASEFVDVERMVAVRRAIGSDVELRLDANGGWTSETALGVLERAGDLDVSFCEEPVAGLDAIAEVGAAAAVPVAIDESARTVDDIARAIGTGSIDVVMIKPQAIGGSDLAMQAVRLVREFGCTPIVSTMIDSTIGVAHAVHVAAAAAVDMAHGLATSELLRHDVATPLPVRDGRISLPAGRGLGVSPG